VTSGQDYLGCYEDAGAVELHGVSDSDYIEKWIVRVCGRCLLGHRDRKDLRPETETIGDGDRRRNA